MPWPYIPLLRSRRGGFPTKFSSHRSFLFFPFRFCVLLIVLISISLLKLSAGYAADRPVIENVRFLANDGVRRVIIALSAEANYEVVTVPALISADHLVSQIYLDFSPARLSIGVPPQLLVNDHIVQTVRAEHLSSNTVRVSLTVENVGTHTISAVRSPAQIVILLRPVRVSSPSGRGVQSKSLPNPPRIDFDPPQEMPRRRKEGDEQGQQSTSVSSPSIPSVLKEERRKASSSATEKKRAPAQLRYRVMIDPGHGGHDPGAIGYDGLQEKTIVLAVSKRLGKKLASRLPVDVLYTRTRDVFIPLPDRTARANSAKADLFISIHANSSPNPASHGIETYYLNNTNDRATLRLAGIENGIRQRNGLQQHGTDLSLILSDLIQTGKEEESILLAGVLQRSLVRHARQEYAEARDLGVKKGPFYVLVGAHMPCVLVELAFLSHGAEGRKLRSPTYQETLAEGLFQGIGHFLRTNLAAENL
jgi:N-acetylmuramoyl-L-alanine amidase